VFDPACSMTHALVMPRNTFCYLIYSKDNAKYGICA
jgi:hypothetical protein